MVRGKPPLSRFGRFCCSRKFRPTHDLFSTFFLTHRTLCSLHLVHLNNHRHPSPVTWSLSSFRVPKLSSLLKPVRLKYFLFLSRNTTTDSLQADPKSSYEGLPRSFAHRGQNEQSKKPNLAAPKPSSLNTSKLAGLNFHTFSFIRPLLGPKFRVLRGGDLKPP